MRMPKKTTLGKSSFQIKRECTLKQTPKYYAFLITNDSRIKY